MDHRDRRMGGARSGELADRPGDDPQQRVGTRGGDQDDLIGLQVLVTRVGPLLGAGQVHPQLEPVEPATGVHDVLGWGLDVQDPLAGGHPLGAAVADDPATTDGVGVLEHAVHHVGDRLEASVRVPWGALGLTGRVVDLTDLIEVNERVEDGQIHICKGAPDGEPLALKTLRRHGDRTDRTARNPGWRSGQSGQLPGVFNSDSGHRNSSVRRPIHDTRHVSGSTSIAGVHHRLTTTSPISVTCPSSCTRSTGRPSIPTERSMRPWGLRLS